MKSDLYEVIVLNSVDHCFLPTFASIEFYCIQQNPVKISTFFLLKKKIHSIPTKVDAPFAIYKWFFFKHHLSRPSGQHVIKLVTLFTTKNIKMR